MPSGKVTLNFEPTLLTSSYCYLSALDGTLTMEASSTSRMLMASALPRWECAQGHMILTCSKLSVLGSLKLAVITHFIEGTPGSEQ